MALTVRVLSAASLLTPISLISSTGSDLHPVQQQRWATKHGGGRSKNGRDSIGKRLGIKKQNGNLVKAGNILVRQRGSSYHAGENVGTGKDYTLYALQPGHVRFQTFSLRRRTFVHIDPLPKVDPAPEFIPQVTTRAEATRLVSA